MGPENTDRGISGSTDGDYVESLRRREELLERREENLLRREEVLHREKEDVQLASDHFRDSASVHAGKDHYDSSQNNVSASGSKNGPVIELDKTEDASQHIPNAKTYSSSVPHQHQRTSYLDERVVWQGSPSQWLNLGHYTVWGLFLCLSPALLVGWLRLGFYERFPNLHLFVFMLSCGIALFAITMICYFSAKLMSQQVVITSNKVTQMSGITAIFRTEKYCELSDVIDIEVPSAGILGMVNRGSLVLMTRDTDQPVIEIKAIANRYELRDRLIPLIRQLRAERTTTVHHPWNHVE